MAESYIYVIGYDLLGPVKIGYSKNPLARLRGLQTGTPQKLNLYHTEAFEEDVIKVVEETLHNDHRHRRGQGEWFDMSVAQAISELKFRAIHEHRPKITTPRKRRKRFLDG